MVCSFKEKKHQLHLKQKNHAFVLVTQVRLMERVYELAPLLSLVHQWKPFVAEVAQLLEGRSLQSLLFYMLQTPVDDLLRSYCLLATSMRLLLKASYVNACVPK